MAEERGGKWINPPPPEDEEDETAEPKARQEKKIRTQSVRARNL
jgi:hypothetical protein